MFVISKSMFLQVYLYLQYLHLYLYKSVYIMYISYKRDDWIIDIFDMVIKLVKNIEILYILFL